MRQAEFLRLGCLYLFIFASLFSLVGLYFWLPASPILARNSESLAWAYQPASCFVRSKSQTNCGMENTKKRTFVLGDSHAQQILFAADYSDHRPAAPTSLLTAEMMQFPWTNVAPSDDQLSRDLRAFLKGLSPDDRVIFSITTGHLRSDNKAELSAKISKIKSLISFVLNDGNISIGELHFVLDNPVMEHNVAHICSRSTSKTVEICGLNAQNYFSTNSLLREIYSDIGSTISKSTAVHIHDIRNNFCEGSICSFYDQDGFILIDSNHLTLKKSVSVFGFLFGNFDPNGQS